MSTSAREPQDEPFTPCDSIVRRIWSDADCVLLVFAGAAAEFALNRAVDWLFVTSELPRDPLGRLFSTAAHAQRIALGTHDEAGRTLAAIRAAHRAVEQRRGARIPDWAHRDVLYLLVDYSARAFELLHRPLSAAEHGELYAAFRRLGEGLGIPALPRDHAGWLADRAAHLALDLARSDHTRVLYAAYRRQLGPWRYQLLLQVQAALVPPRVRDLLRLPAPRLALALTSTYAQLHTPWTRALVQRALIPPAHLAAVRRLHVPQSPQPLSR